MGRRRVFSREFKTEAVWLVVERGVAVAQAAKDLGIHENAIAMPACEPHLLDVRLRGGFVAPEVLAEEGAPLVDSLKLSQAVLGLSIQLARDHGAGEALNPLGR